jgi:hypothetical protein
MVIFMLDESRPFLQLFPKLPNECSGLQGLKPEISPSDLGHLGRKSRIGGDRTKNGFELTNFVIPAQNPRRFDSSGYHGNLRISLRHKKSPSHHKGHLRESGGSMPCLTN